MPLAPRHLALMLALCPLAGCDGKTAPPPRAETPAQAASQPGNAPVADIQAGRAKYSSFCAGCHGPQAEGIGHYPKLAGQGATTIETKLAVFRSGQTIGPRSGNMIPIARMLTEAEVKQVGAYLGSL